MTPEQLVAFLENQIRLLGKAFEESDGMMVGADRHEEWEYIGNGVPLFVNKEQIERHRAQNPHDWSEESGTAKALDPIRNEIEAMKATVETLKGEK